MPRWSTNWNRLAGVKAVALDAVGTLIRPSPPAECVYESIGGRHGSRLTADELAKRFRLAFESEEARDRSAGWMTDPEREVDRWRRIVASVFDDLVGFEACFHELWNHFARPESWRCMPGVEALAELSQTSTRLAIASNFDSRLRSVIAGHPELRIHGPIVISAEVGWRKPARQFFHAVCSALECRPNEILFVGDDFTSDYIGAQAVGMQTVLIDPHERADAKTDSIRSINDILELRSNS